MTKGLDEVQEFAVRLNSARTFACMTVTPS